MPPTTPLAFEVLSNAPNAPVVRHPSRRFPGVLIQGDTLHTWCSDLAALASRLDPESEAGEDCRLLLEQLAEVERTYVETLNEHGIPLPFVR